MTDGVGGVVAGGACVRPLLNVAEQHPAWMPDSFFGASRLLRKKVAAGLMSVLGKLGPQNTHKPIFFKGKLEEGSGVNFNLSKVVELVSSPQDKIAPLSLFWYAKDGGGFGGRKTAAYLATLKIWEAA